MSKEKTRKPKLNIPFKLILILGSIVGFLYYLQTRFMLFEINPVQNFEQVDGTVNGLATHNQQYDIAFVDGDRKNLSILNSDGEIYRLSVKIAKSRSTQAKGLMFRKSMPQNEGMLFVYDKNVNHKFWMKNCLIDLDMIFISKKWEIVDIVHSAQACHEDPCPTYGSNVPYRYVLETNGGFAENNSINPGDLIQWQLSDTE